MSATPMYRHHQLVSQGFVFLKIYLLQMKEHALIASTFQRLNSVIFNHMLSCSFTDYAHHWRTVKVNQICVIGQVFSDCSIQKGARINVYMGVCLGSQQGMGNESGQCRLLSVCTASIFNCPCNDSKIKNTFIFLCVAVHHPLGDSQLPPMKLKH